MTWFTWRLHRTEAVIGVPLFATLIVIMLLAIQSVDSAYEAARDLGCFNNRVDILCDEQVNNYYVVSSRWDNLTTLLHGVPLAAAALLVIPTLQELERGTHRLTWTQSISRRRWSLYRIGFLAGVAALVTIVWVVTTSNWRSSILRNENWNFSRSAFELSPEVLFGYGLFAVALGLAAAVVVRRLIPTLALLAIGFIGTRVFTTFFLRERYRSPLEAVTPASETGQFDAFENAWVVDESWLTATGERLSWDRVNQLCSPAITEQNTDGAYQQCLIDNDLAYFRSFHPAERLGQFQLIEMALYLGLAAGLFAVAYWWLTRRAA